jgi:hypothetical protein
VVSDLARQIPGKRYDTRLSIRDNRVGMRITPRNLYALSNKWQAEQGTGVRPSIRRGLRPNLILLDYEMPHKASPDSSKKLI